MVTTERPAMDEAALAAFLHRSTDGSIWRPDDAEAFSFRRFYEYYESPAELLLSRAEFEAAIDGDGTPNRVVSVFANLSCGTRMAPHLVPEMTGILRALGVDFVAASGRRFCCGKIFHSYDRGAAGDQVVRASLGRIEGWGAGTVVHGCPSCQIYYSRYLDRAEPRPALRSLHFTEFVEARLAELGDAVPWRSRPNARVLVEDHGVSLSPVHDEVMASVARMLARVPGVEVLGRWTPPTLGSACAYAADGQAKLAFLSDTERAQVLSELRAQALDAGGADTLVTTDKQCQREWCKFGTPSLDVRSYISILADALGCSQPDRFKQMWQLHDPAAVFARTRPYWTSWGLPEERGRWLAFWHFDPEHSNWRTRCACGGDADKCTTGRGTGISG